MFVWQLFLVCRCFVHSELLQKEENNKIRQLLRQKQFELTAEPYFEKTGLPVHITSSDGICLLILHMMARYHIYWDVQKLKAQMGTQMNHFEGRKESF